MTGIVAKIAADQIEREYGLWVADEDDVKGVAEPAARILYRRLPDEAKGSDTLDLFGLGLALAGYVAKNLHIKSQLARMRASAELHGVDVQDQAA